MNVYCPKPTCPEPENPAGTKFCQACGTDLLSAGGYRLVKLLGQGGFGRTFLAENPKENGSRCVVKQIFIRPVSDGTTFLRKGSAIASNTAFRDEADRIKQLGKHPQIPRLLAAIETESSQYLVQEFAPGQDLQRQVEATGPWPEERVRSLLLSLVAVLQYVHSFQVIHRDIKPANIVAPTGTWSIKKSPPMLVDFGSAKWVRQAAAHTVIGSAGYAAPEQSMGQATFASDIYSLGLTCLYLLTGVHPFQLYSAVEERWVWQDYLRTPVSAGFAQVLNKMVARSLQQRYETMEQVERALTSSQNLLKSAPQELPQKLLEQIKTSVPGLKNLLTSGSDRPQVQSSQNHNVQTASPNKSNKKQAMALPAQHLPTQNPPTQQWEKRYRLAPNIGLTQILAVSPNGQEFASGSSDGSIHLWQVASARLMHTFPKRRLVGRGHSGAVTALVFHPDGRVLYSASADGTIKEWDLNARQLLNTLTVPGWTLTDLTITLDGKQLIGASRDGKIVIWEIASLLPVEQLSQHQQCVNAIAVSTFQHQPTLVSASDDGTLKLWQADPKTAKHLFRLAKTVNLRRVTLAQPSGTKEILKEALTETRAIALALDTHPTDSAKDQPLAIATSTGTLLLYTLNRYGDIAGPLLLQQSPQPITSLAMSRDRHLAVGTDDRVLTLWSTEAASCVAQLSHDWGVSAIAFTPDSRTLIAASADEVISIWQRKR